MLCDGRMLTLWTARVLVAALGDAAAVAIAESLKTNSTLTYLHLVGRRRERIRMGPRSDGALMDTF